MTEPESEPDELVEYLRERQPHSLVVRISGGGIETHAWPNEGVCDFCSAPCPSASYKAESIVLQTPAGNEWSSVGDWAACAQCAMLIENAERNQLIERSLERFTKMHGNVPREQARKALQIAQDAFWKARLR